MTEKIHNYSSEFQMKQTLPKSATVQTIRPVIDELGLKLQRERNRAQILQLLDDFQMNP